MSKEITEVKVSTTSATPDIITIPLHDKFNQGIPSTESPVLTEAVNTLVNNGKIPADKIKIEYGQDTDDKKMPLNIRMPFEYLQTITDEMAKTGTEIVFSGRHEPRASQTSFEIIPGKEFIVGTPNGLTLFKEQGEQKAKQYQEEERKEQATQEKFNVLVTKAARTNGDNELSKEELNGLLVNPEFRQLVPESIKSAVSASLQNQTTTDALELNYRDSKDPQIIKKSQLLTFPAGVTLSNKDFPETYSTFSPTPTPTPAPNKTNDVAPSK
jgi:hypothetical protein